MRQAGTLPTEQDATRFADYLLMLGVTTRVLADRDGFSVWVRDEEKTEQARSELEQFRQNPTDARYGKAHTVAREIRQRDERETAKARKNIVDAQAIRSRWARGAAHRTPLTMLLAFVSILVTIATSLGQDYNNIARKLVIAEYELIEKDGRSYPSNRWPGNPGLGQVKEGQIWRLVTPIFLHHGPLHILFNIMMLVHLGRAVEMVRGTWRFGVLVLLIAAASNYCQFVVPNIDEWLLHPFTFIASPHPAFGGMSGVVYGLFGYIWMKAKFEPISGFFMDQHTITIMIVWFFACLLGVVGSVANTAHGVGLLAGMAIGYGSAKWSLRPR
jgi:GlpG protein